MKLLRHGAKGAEKPALLDAQGGLRDLSQHMSDIVCATLTPGSLQRLRELDINSCPSSANRRASHRRGAAWASSSASV